VVKVIGPQAKTTAASPDSGRWTNPIAKYGEYYHSFSSQQKILGLGFQNRF